MNLPTIDNLLHIGVSQSPITPPTGFTISGPEFPDRSSIGIDDDLFVRCITLTSYAETAAIVSLDAWGISEILRNRIAAAVSNTSGIPCDRVMVTCTGNGTSPPLWRDEDDLPSEYSNYIAYLPRHRRRRNPRIRSIPTTSSHRNRRDISPQPQLFRRHTPRRASRDRTRKATDRRISRCRRADQMYALQLRLPGNHHRQFR